MRSLTLALTLLAFTVRAQAADAPVLDSTVVVVPVSQNEHERILIAKVIVACKAENEELKTAMKTQLHPLVIVGLVVLAAGAGVAGGYAIAKVTTPKP